MPRNALSNPIVLATLGALLERPSHAYGLATTLITQGLPVNRGSLYDTLDAMARTGWIQAGESEQAGKRPKRTIYTITTLGRAELIQRLTTQLHMPRREYPEFLGAVAHIGILGKNAALEALIDRQAQLASRLAEDRHTYTEAIQKGVPRLFIVEAEYALALLTAEHSWICNIIEDIQTGTISWPAAQHYHKEVMDGDITSKRA